ncbi:MAG: UDP-N-acetylglucosamine--LPS N-acetylglucosamine transferase [Pseudomonadota bacterium]
MTKKILAIASAGGHWQQLMALRPAFEPNTVEFATTLRGLPDQYGIGTYATLADCNRDTPIKALRCAFQLAWLIVKQRPDVVVSTGALPGVIGLAIGRIMRAQTIWVDSVANAEEMSSSGRMAKRFAKLCLSQWEAPARAAGANYMGSIL